MTPKTIHYCWFGRNPKPELVLRCIESWKRLCPDYSIKEWNEDMFDISSNTYVKEAYENRKWAFVSDYVRLFVLANEGGIYMDTDVELVKNLDGFLSHTAFCGFERTNFISTAVMGSEKNGRWVTRLLADYDDRHFVMPYGAFDMTTNVVTISNTTRREFPVVMNNTYQVTPDGLALYPKQYFAPKSPGVKRHKVTEMTYAIHHFDGSWIDGNKKIVHLKLRYSFLLNIMRTALVAVIGDENFRRLRK